jgi:hypothetical protein
MSLSKRLLAGTGAVVMAAGAMLFAQAGDATKVMADMRKALGGEQKLAAVKSLSATGKSQRSTGETSMGGDYELMLELPDKYFTKQVMWQTPRGDVLIKAGFNGDGLIQETEQAAGIRVISGSSTSAGGSGANATPEQKAADQQKQVANTKQEFARMALGMFGASVAGYPLEYTYGGTAESPDGKADIINVKGPGDFAGKLFVDQTSHLPVMFSWMAKEPPIQITLGGSGGGPGAPGGGVQFSTGASGGKGPTQEQRDKATADRQARMKEAEARRKVVEYRMFYSHYQSVDGLQLPHMFRQAIGGNATNEVTIEKYKVNPKIDPKKFETVK